MRDALKTWISKEGPLENAGQRLAYGLELKSKAGKGELIKSLCKTRPTPLYGAAFKRWHDFAIDCGFACATLEIRGRLFHGLGDAGVAETNVAMHSLYGVPVLRDSALKGLTAAFARALTKEGDSLLSEEQVRWLFGGPSSGGRLQFHEGWWVPDSDGPFAMEVDTPHHGEYYASHGARPATDFDDPVPVPQVSVTGKFFVAIEGDAYPAQLALGILKRALGEWGFGARVFMGYGRLDPVDEHAVR